MRTHPVYDNDIFVAEFYVENVVLKTKFCVLCVRVLSEFLNFSEGRQVLQS